MKLRELYHVSLSVDLTWKSRITHPLSQSTSLSLSHHTHTLSLSRASANGGGAAELIEEGGHIEGSLL